MIDHDFLQSYIGQYALVVVPTAQNKETNRSSAYIMSAALSPVPTAAHFLQIVGYADEINNSTTASDNTPIVRVRLILHSSDIDT